MNKRPSLVPVPEWGSNDPANPSVARALAEYVRSLTDFRMVSPDPPWGHMGMTLVAVLYAPHMRYETVLGRAMRLRDDHPDAVTTGQFARTIQELGLPHLVDINNPQARDAVVEVIDILHEAVLETEVDVRESLEDFAHRERLRQVKGIGPKTGEFLRVRCGESEAVAVDMWMVRMLRQAGIHLTRFWEQHEVISRAAYMLGVTPATLGESIWSYMRRGGAASRGSEAGGEHYVYLYRDTRDRVQYVGYGRGTDRPTVHLVGSHNEGLNEFLRSRQYRLEIAGPFGDAQTGRAVETALISALKPECNISEGEARWRFRPLGVPLAFADRQVEPELLFEGILAAQGKDRGPVLFVIVSGVDLADDRLGYNSAAPPSDEAIRVLVDHWWQLQRFVPEWTADPASSPGLLIGIYGSPGRQTIIASLRVNRDGWADAETDVGGMLRVPLVDPLDLDAFSLRGRRVSREAGLKFGGVPALFFVRLGTDGKVIG